MNEQVCSISGMIMTGENLYSTTLFTTDFTLTGLRLYSGLYCHRPMMII